MGLDRRIVGVFRPGWGGGRSVRSRTVNRLEVVAGRVIDEERPLEGSGWRVRWIEEAPDGDPCLGGWTEG